jgi:tRNA-modifying protein YgfZ
VRRDLAEDYESLRNGIGAVAVARDVIRVSGPDALEFMQGQCSQDLASLQVEGSLDSLILEPQGKLVAMARVTRTGDEELLVDVAGGFGDKVVARLERFRLRVKAEIDALDWRCVAVRGARAAQSLTGVESATVTGRELVVAYSWGMLEGADLLGVDPEPPQGARTCAAEALESLRIEAGVPEMGKELDGRTIPAEADLLQRCVSFTKGCYTGQELVARLDARGNRVARRLRGFVVDEVDREVTPGDEVIFGGKVVGQVTSAAWCPGLGAVGALGYVHRDVTVPSYVGVRPRGASDEEASVVRAEVRELPLVS